MSDPQPASWTIYIAGDCCPDYTWGYAEEPTRQAAADLVAAHLDAMTRTDAEALPDRNRYNMAVTMEAVCFLERYPERAEELARRVREGRLLVSPFLNNSLWGLQSVEGALRGFYPARRLERAWGTRFEIAEHTELPSLPWGMATLLAGCGIRWLSIPFLNYDSTFAQLENPPFFLHEGPDGSQVRTILDRWACLKGGYTQGSRLVRKPEHIDEWIAHYEALGDAYPWRFALASGTHGDLNPTSGERVPPLVQALMTYNASPGPHPTLVNATVAQFCQAVEEAGVPLQAVRGCFGHSWELWPVSVASEASAMRVHEQSFLAAETLLALALARQPQLAEETRAVRERGEWCWAMLGEHAWNGTDAANKKVNVDLRHGWNEELAAISARLQETAWSGLGRSPAADRVTVVNPLSIPRADLAQVETPETAATLVCNGTPVPSQIVEDQGRRSLCFVSPHLDGYGVASLQLQPGEPVAVTSLTATPTSLDGPHYRVTVDSATGGICSLVHKATGSELVAPGAARAIGQTVYFDGQEHPLSDVTTEVVALGPVLARLRVSGKAGEVAVSTSITIYDELDRVDLDIEVEKPVTDVEQRLCHTFPVLRAGDCLRIETPAAVLIPRPQPEGDLLPGADPRRFAIQGFVDISRPEGGGVRIAPREAFALRLDLDTLCFEALGNDQNYDEVTRDQQGVTSFRFRYSVSGYDGPYDQAATVAWSRTAGAPILASIGAVAPEGLTPPVTIDPARAIATCLKPADDPEAGGGLIVRLWETAGQPGPLLVKVAGARRATLVDLVERDLEDAPIRDGEVAVDLRAFGFASLRLAP
jgi:hypothetical protein